MNYNNDTVRRQARLLPEEKAIRLLKEGEYGVLSLITPEGAYGIPISYVWDGADCIYCHCAPEGRKLRAIAHSPKVSFCVVGRTNVLSDKFTTEYESIVVTGTARIGLPADERMKALELILDKYSPNDKEVGMKYAEKSFGRTEIIRLDIDSVSGKAKINP